MSKKISFLVLILVSFISFGCTGPKVDLGSIVTFDYTGTFKKTGKEFDTTKGKKPLEVVIGNKQLLKAFEDKLIGMRKGSSKSFTLKPEEAYGVRDPKKVIEIDRDKRFTGVELKKDAIIYAVNKDAAGNNVSTPLKVVDFTDTKVTIDYNHPLAGEELKFKVKVIDVKPFDDRTKVITKADLGAAKAKTATK